MPELNPYESPQLIERGPDAQRLDDSYKREYLLSPEWKDVCIGAERCYFTVLVIFGSIVFSLFIVILTGAFQVGRGIAAIGGTYLISGSMILGWVSHWIGLLKLQKISYPETARRYFTQSIITFFLIHVVVLFSAGWASVGGLQGKNGDLHYLLIGAGVAVFGLYTVHTFTMLLGVREVGRFVQNETIVSNASSAYYTVAVMVVIEALSLAAIVTQSFTGFKAMEVVTMIAFIAGNGIAVAFYANAMKQFASCGNVRPDIYVG